MGWKSLAWAGCLLPVLTGCATTPRAAPYAANKLSGSQAQRGTERAPRQDARLAWQAVVNQYPRQTFTDEFRAGFLAGYSDSRERGGPAVLQAPSARDYKLGVKYGSDVALASGHWQIPIVPALPDGVNAPLESTAFHTTPAVPYVPTGSGKAPTEPLAQSSPVADRPGGKFGDPKNSYDPLAPLPPVQSSGPRKSNPPPIKPFNPALPDEKSTAPGSPHPDLLPVPDPPLPIPDPQIEPVLGPPVGVNSSTSGIAKPGANRVPGVSPPASVPLILGDIPVIPFQLVPAEEILLPSKK